MRKRCLTLAALVVALTLLAGASCAESVLASAKTTLDGSSKNKISNITIAIDAIDGTALCDGDRFSFNEIVGPRTSSYGYKSALNGRGVKVIGGGVAQVATTIYLALKKLDGIEYIERNTYTNFKDNYVSSKKNAIMVDYKAGQDFCFDNLTGQDMRIDVWIGNNNVNCALVALDYGTSASDGIVTMYVPDDQLDNVSLACDSIYDTSLEYGNIFSFNDTVGPRNARCGYVKAVNGRGATVAGGGVDMVASAIYMAVKDMNYVSVLDRTTYRGFSQSYVSDTSDAIYTDYGDGVDFSFAYSGYGILSIYTYVVGNTLYCEVIEF
ncbi:MAG: VanW family protein [Clostridia bacterium]|nr:VanW family protein [Clostridia bacterium]